MSADVICMALASVPSGEQSSRFLAVGLADNTVRIISLDPSVSTVIPIYLFAINSQHVFVEFQIYYPDTFFCLLTVKFLYNSGLFDTFKYASIAGLTRIIMHC